MYLIIQLYENSTPMSALPQVWQFNFFATSKVKLSPDEIIHIIKVQKEWLNELNYIILEGISPEYLAFDNNRPNQQKNNWQSILEININNQPIFMSVYQLGNMGNSMLCCRYTNQSEDCYSCSHVRNNLYGKVTLNVFGLRTKISSTM